MSRFFLLLDTINEDRFPGHVRAAILKYMNAQLNSKTTEPYLACKKRKPAVHSTFAKV